MPVSPTPVRRVSVPPSFSSFLVLYTEDFDSVLSQGPFSLDMRKTTVTVQDLRVQNQTKVDRTVFDKPN